MIILGLIILAIIGIVIGLSAYGGYIVTRDFEDY